MEQASRYVSLVLIWAAYLILHSFFASNFAKKYFDRTISLNGSAYRIQYTLFSTIGLLAILWWMHEMPARIYFEIELLKYIASIFTISGVLITAISFRHLSGSEFLGLKKANQGKRLETRGIHANVRHPIYSGTILILIGFFLYKPTDIILISDAVIFIYLPIGIYFEEKKLIQEFGSAYEEYKRDVPAIIPRFLE